jgi:hypothetical protein
MTTLRYFSFACQKRFNTLVSSSRTIMPSTPPQYANSIRILRVTCVFWLIAKIISFKVWTTSRIFPVIPVFDSINNIPGWVHLLLYAVSIICLLCIAGKPDNRVFIYTLLLSEISSAMLDYTRWQPWEYQYLFIIFIFLTNREDRSIRSTIGFLLAALYIYSGLHKLNTGFLLQIWDNMILNSVFHISHTVRSLPVIFYSGYSLGALEFCGGLALLFKKTQRTAAIFLITMHLFNLLWLGPWGANYNVIVWPWNMVMCIYLFLLFIKNGISSFKPLFVKGNVLVFIAWGLLPALNFAGYWDHYMSGSLYSGKLTLMAICIDSKSGLEPYVSKTDTHRLCPNMSLIKLQSWALKELKVPPYPQIRVYKKTAAVLRRQYPGCICYLYTYGHSQKREIKE